MNKRIIGFLAVFFVLALLLAAGLLYRYYQQVSLPALDVSHVDVDRYAGYDDVRPILEQRCAVCHGCYDAPCQLKLTAWEGVMRGGHADRVYDGQRLLAATPTRLFDDAHSVAEWRDKGFHPVLNEGANTVQNNLQNSALYQMLRLKKYHPLPDKPVLSDRFDFSLNRSQQCKGAELFDQYILNNPLAGMPYGLPAISDEEFRTIEQWIAIGAPGPERHTLPEAVQRQLQQWEAFLNGDSLKAQLINRYIFEHWFLAHLYFADDGEHHYFQLVRSVTPPGKPIAVIASRRPFDDPGVARVYYRLRPVKESILVKTHMPYRLDVERMQQLKTWFYQPDYTVDTLPSYKPEVASNPFRAFEQLPVRARYRLMLEEAQFTIMGFIKGPVCRGQVALNVINDQFWVFFTDPEFNGMEEDAEFLAQQSQHLRLPAEEESNAPVLLSWQRYAEAQRHYLQARSQYLQDKAMNIETLPLSLIWDGDGDNRNAALTIFRHYDNATVVRGLVGQPPKTAWVISYSLLERIHYLLVAGFDVFGNVGHQLHTRLYMDFLRMEGEFNFLSLLPQQQRTQLRDYWYRGAQKHVREFISWEGSLLQLQADINFTDGDQQLQLYQVLQQYLSVVLEQKHNWQQVDAVLRESLAALQAISGQPVSVLPQVLVLVIDDDSLPLEQRYYTLINNSAHSNISHLFMESDRRLPQEDTLTVARGVISAYPNVFLQVSKAQLPAFVAQLSALRQEKDYTALLDRYGIRRTDLRFWVFSDRLYQDMQTLEPIEAGLLDYNRLENR